MPCTARIAHALAISPHALEAGDHFSSRVACFIHVWNRFIHGCSPRRLPHRTLSPSELEVKQRGEVKERSPDL